MRLAEYGLCDEGKAKRYGKLRARDNGHGDQNHEWPQDARSSCQLALRRRAGEVLKCLSASMRAAEHGMFLGLKRFENLGKVITALFVIGLERIATNESCVAFIGLAHPFAVITYPYQRAPDSVEAAELKAPRAISFARTLGGICHGRACIGAKK